MLNSNPKPKFSSPFHAHHNFLPLISLVFFVDTVVSDDSNNFPNEENIDCSSLKNSLTTSSGHLKVSSVSTSTHVASQDVWFFFTLVNLEKSISFNVFFNVIVFFFFPIRIS